MQAAQVGWSVNEARLPWEIRLYFLYLLVVAGVSIARALSLARQFWRFTARRRASPMASDTEAVRADRLATLALSRPFWLDASDPASIFPSILPDQPEDRAAFLRVLQRAENKFSYISEICAAKVGSLKKLAVLTLLVSAFVLVYGATRILTEITTLKGAPIGLLSGSIAEVLVPLAGIFISAVLYAVYVAYEGALNRRRARWRYFSATAAVHTFDREHRAQS